jgi:aspartyl-tRNA(Asn)/glutamyl-tRNA(Gln) amidotransferase subunit B
MPYTRYEPVIGLEVHIQLLTKSKAFSSDPTRFGAEPNTNISVISLGHPGTLPRFNKQVLEYAVKLGLACGCEITQVNQFARKNYFYADLPKGYQITQDKTPVCKNGCIVIKLADGGKRAIELTRIHMEEDAGKSMHDQDPYDSLIDLNRAGVPLLEMVTEPVIQNSDEAHSFLSEVRKLVRYLDICDGNMDEGSMRCDANVSIKPSGSVELGTKVEVKNMNSIRNVQRAIDYEIKRQIDILEKGGQIIQETRSFDAGNGTTFSLRGKEKANDYRYFPEPDLTPILIDSAFIESIKAAMPELPEALYQRFMDEYKLSEYDASSLTETKATALYFTKLTKFTENYKAAANWLNGPIRSYLNEQGFEISQFMLKPKQIAELIDLIDSGKVSFSIASQKVFPALMLNPEKSCLVIAEANNWIQDGDSDSLNLWISQVIGLYPEKVIEYKAGKTGLIGLFMGEIMRLSKGKADPKLATTLVKEALEKS